MAQLLPISDLATVGDGIFLLWQKLAPAQNEIQLRVFIGVEFFAKRNELALRPICKFPFDAWRDPKESVGLDNLTLVPPHNFGATLRPETHSEWLLWFLRWTPKTARVSSLDALVKRVKHPIL